MKGATQFIDQLSENQSQIVSVLDDLILSNPEVISKIRYSIPFYYRRSWICYLNPIKSDGIDLVFLRGRELSNVQELLDTTGRKQVAGLKIFNIDQLSFNSLREILQEALILDDQVPYTSSKRNKVI